jgi:hypothetical protein
MDKTYWNKTYQDKTYLPKLYSISPKCIGPKCIDDNTHQGQNVFAAKLISDKTHWHPKQIGKKISRQNMLGQNISPDRTYQQTKLIGDIMYWPETYCHCQKKF